MIAPRLLRTRVARRILALFFVCALLPVAIFAVLGYNVVANRLEEDAREQLRQGSKTAGLVLYDRLQMLSSELARLGGMPNASDSGSLFRAVFLEDGAGRLTAIRGRPSPVPHLTARQEAHLAQGLPVLITVNDSGAATLYMGMANPARGAASRRLWGTASSDVLLGQQEGMSPAPPGTELCVLDAGGRPLSCPGPEAARAAANWEATPGGHPGWRRDDSLFIMGHWNLFLASTFSTPTWSVALSMPADAVFEPLSAFRRVSLLTVALAGLLVFFLSHSQLRKRMTPLAELESGVRRISSGDFSMPVAIRSDDEFETLADAFNGMAGDLQARMGELSAVTEGALLALARTIDANSPWTAGHSEGVTQGALEIGRRLGYDAPTLDRLRRGGLLHDIGKIGVPATILNKPGPLTEAERTVVQSHPGIGANILQPIPVLADIIPLVRSHHELLDGSGYPDGLRGEAIPELVRVLTVADIFDALISDRPYRPGLSRGEAMAHLQGGAGRRYDARAVDALGKAIAEGWSATVPGRRPPPQENPLHMEVVT